MEEVVMEVPVKSGGLDITLSVANLVVPEPYPVESERFGCTIGDFLGTVDEEGRYVPPPANSMVFDGSSIKHIGSSAMRQLFYGNKVLKEANLENVESVDTQGLYNTFSYTDLTKLNLKGLKVVQGSGLDYMCQQCSSLVELDMSGLESIKGQMSQTFVGCGLVSLSFDSLKEITVSNGFSRTFNSCTRLKKLYFPSLVSVHNGAFGNSSSYYMLRYCTQRDLEIHFRADMQETIEAMTGYDAKWGGTNATIYFDL